VKQGVTVLVVDDEPTVRNAIKRLLEHAGHTVDTADGGEAALELLAQKPYELVVTDFSMPGMHGDQLVARIRQILPNQRIIMATAFVEEYKVFGQTAAPVDALLLKPFSLQELYEAIARVMDREDVRPWEAPPPPIIGEKPLEDTPPPHE
jgi:CheY-like chemotaxis protein